MPKYAYKCKLLRSLAQISATLLSAQSLPKTEIEGEENFPIQVHSDSVIFIAVDCYFYFCTGELNCMRRANK